jgi:hypothetical protein
MEDFKKIPAILEKIKKEGTKKEEEVKQNIKQQRLI